MDSVQRVFISNMRRIRTQLGYSQMKLAEISDLSTSFITEIENGNKFPSTKNIEKIATALSVKPYILFIDDENDPAWDKIVTLSKISEKLKKKLIQDIEVILKECF